MVGSSSGAPVDRVVAVLRSHLVRQQPARLLVLAAFLAAGAVALFVLVGDIHAPRWTEGGAGVPPAWAGTQATLDAQGVRDADADGLADSLENLVYGTDPGRFDSSGSGIPDGWAVRHGYDPLDPGLAQLTAAAPPMEALPETYRGAWPARYMATLEEIYSFKRPADWNESAAGPWSSGLDPTQWDSGTPGLPDGWLLHHGLDPTAPGIAEQRPLGADGLSVAEAFQHDTDPHRQDTDGDGLADRLELNGPIASTSKGVVRLPPTDPARFDTSGSGVCDGYLVHFGLDPSNLTAALSDVDNDGATTKQEHAWSARQGQDACGGKGLDPTRQRSGRSVIPDGWHLRHGTDPLAQDVDNKTTQTSQTDPRPPGLEPSAPLALTVLAEYKVRRPAEWSEARDGPWWGGTSPAANDTDGDGLGDAWELAGFEVAASTNVLRATPTPYRSSSDPTKKDTDGDGLADASEVDPAKRDGAAGGRTDPQRWDTDFDGLSDGREVALGFGLDPARADSVGDLMPDGGRLQHLEAVAASILRGDPYGREGPPTGPRTFESWLAAAKGADGLPRPLTRAAMATLVGPGGDVDGDGEVNVADADIDNDTLINGWEAEPARYALSPFGLGEFESGRPGTDPLNRDTDGDTLRDAWEVTHGRPDFRLPERYTLDPARWNSDAELEGTQPLPDSDEDPDDDGVRLAVLGSTGTTVLHERFPNGAEQSYRTDPNRPDTDRDGLHDGWKVYWGITYPSLDAAGIPQDAPRPQLGVNQSTVAWKTFGYQRATLDPRALLPGETAGPGIEVRDPSDLARTRLVHRVTGSLAFRLLDAQESGTNPYRLDTDGDGMQDWWEYLHRRPMPGLPAGDCVETGGPVPVQPDAQQDPDADALDNLHEFLAGTDPLCTDSDAGGVRDGDEHLFDLDPANPSDDQTLLVKGTDTDDDGVVDFEEITGIRSLGYDTYLGSRAVRTRHDHPDTDGDGLLDGLDMPRHDVSPGGWPADDPRSRRFLALGITYFRTGDGGYVFLGERERNTDPRDGDDAGIGVPSGWLAAHGITICTVNIPGCTPTAAANHERYSLARPTWWDEGTHGPWWGGARPQDDLDGMRIQQDLDKDGLMDFDGPFGYEDPMPASNLDNEWRPIDAPLHGIEVPARAHPADPDLDDKTRRLLAQAYLSPRLLNSRHYARDLVAKEDAPRLEPCLVVDPLPNGGTLHKGREAVVTGRVTAGCASGSPLPGVTVEARLGNPSQPFGADVTDADGRFRIPLNVTAQHFATLPAHATVFMGRTNGTVAWEADPTKVAVGKGFLTVRTYATPAAWTPVALASSTNHLPVTVTSSSKLTLDVPATARTGETLLVRARLTDGAGAPLVGQVKLGWQGKAAACPSDCATTGQDGVAEFALPVPHSWFGERTLAASFAPAQALLTGSSSTATIALQRPASAAITGVPSAIDAGKHVEVKGRVTVAGSEPPGKLPLTLNLTRNGESVSQVALDTSPDGRFSALVPVPAGASRGAHVLSAAVAATPSTTATEAQVATLVRSIPRFTNVDEAPIQLGAPATVVARLVEPDGTTPLGGAKVAVDLGGTQSAASTDADGWLRVRFAQSMPFEPLRQKLSFAGDASHAGAQHLGERAVLSATRLELGEGTVVRGGTTLVTARLTDAEHRPLARLPARLDWGATNGGSAVSDAQGRLAFEVPIAPDAALGPISVKAHFNGSRGAGLAPSEASGTWSVLAPASLSLPNGTFLANSPLPPGRLVDGQTGLPLPGKAVRLLLNTSKGLATHDLTTDTSGSFPVPAPAGSHDLIALTARYAGDGHYAATEAASLVDRRIPTKLQITAPAKAVAGRSLQVLASVTDLDGNPVPTGEVQFWTQGSPPAAWPVLDGTARAELVPSLNRSGGPVVLEARFLGNPTYATSQASTPLMLLAPVDVRVDIQRALPGKTATLVVRVTQGGQAMPFTPVSLALEGADTGLAGETDRNGVAVFHVTQTEHALNVAARYPGDERFGPAMAHGTLEPAIPPSFADGVALPLAWILGTLAVILVALPAIIARLRKEPLEQALERARRILSYASAGERDLRAAFRILEDAALALGLLAAPAPTARELEGALQKTLPPRVHAPLSRFMGSFEEVRYGKMPLDGSGRTRALRALDDVLASLSATPA